MKRILKFIGNFLLAFIVFLLWYLASTYGLSRIPVSEEPNANDEVAIYIFTTGVHTDIVVPTFTQQMDWSREIKFTNTTLADSTFNYLAMGWGDKRFFLETPSWSELKVSTAFKGGTGLNTTAIHATYYRRMEESESCRKIIISEEQYTRLIDFIFRSFQKDENGHFINIKTKANYGNTDAFYEANGRTSLFNTCNSWVNTALKTSGQKACLWTAFKDGIFLRYEQ